MIISQFLIGLEVNHLINVYFNSQKKCQDLLIFEIYIKVVEENESMFEIS